MPQRDEDLRNLLMGARTLAVIGIKNDEREDAHRVPRYMQEAGYRILPVNPKLDSVLGETAVATVDRLEEPADVVVVFRAAENVPAHVDEILSMRSRPSAVWMQLGIHHGESAARLRAAGISVVHDRCIMVDHRRLLGDG